MAAAARATLRLTLGCDNRCVFCAQDGLAEPEATTGDDALGALRAVADELTIVGGEPTADARLPGTIAAARAAGFARVGVQTHARRLASPAYTAALRDAGLTDVHASLHGAQPAVHDYHTGVPGSLAQSLAGIAAARAAGLVVVVTTVLTRSNFRSLAQLPPLLRARGVAAWCIAVPRVAGRLAGAFDRVAPRLGLALPFALHALEAARALGLPAAVAGAPLCALGPLAAYALDEAPRAYGAACDGCAARTRCPGLDPVYLARFGGDELAALGSAPPAPSLPPALARLFVGVGELVLVPATVAPPPPARVALPVLGRVQPALNEAAAGAPRRSGESLREILPALFERPDE